MTLSGDRGFASILSPDSPSLVLVDAAGRNPDIDTPEDLTALERSYS
jgi:CTP:molybdopterin cytidylyltransferase MocA